MMITGIFTEYTCRGYEKNMADRIIVEKALETISQNLKELRNSTDIDRDIYMTDLRARRFIE